MRRDVDSLLLDRFFQPMTNRASDWITCFGMARVSLVCAVIEQIPLLISDLGQATAPLQGVAAAGLSLFALVGAQQAWALIARTERQMHKGGINQRRVTLRWQRLAWLAVTVWSVASGTIAGGGSEFAISGVGVAWLGLVYFVSCTPTPPPGRTEPRQVFA